MSDELQRTKARLREVAAELLEQLMSEISEDHYAAGWNGDLENDLWTIVRHGGGGYGMGEVTSDVVVKLRGLSADCEGWHDGNGWVPIADWRRRYAEWFEHKHLPCLRTHIDWIRKRVGMRDPLDRLTTDADVERAREDVRRCEMELPDVLRDAGLVPAEAQVTP